MSGRSNITKDVQEKESTEADKEAASVSGDDKR